MKDTWASGAVELLKHADGHIDLDSAFDKRMAFISIDNSVEISIRTFLSLPPDKSGIKVKRKDVDDAFNSFPKLVDLLFSHAATKLTGLDSGDIEHYLGRRPAADHRAAEQQERAALCNGIDERHTDHGEAG